MKIKLMMKMKKIMINWIISLDNINVDTYLNFFDLVKIKSNYIKI